MIINFFKRNPHARDKCQVVFQAIFQSAVRECERKILMDLLQHKSPNSTTEAHKHAVLDSCPRTCATITDTNHLYLLFLNYCYVLDLILKLTHMFSIILRHFLSIPSLMPSLWTSNNFQHTIYPPPPPFQWSKSTKATHHGSVVHHDSSNGPCAYCHALVAGARQVIQAYEMKRRSFV